ncbi:OLC1v1020669C1 [Oldenlandia corymbosa var. corymbosa]|uniref:OLC1v1020669C1 n=1 Tax=Oldenlandia corymbosa var. corymbosa TaxID=529605 RepID=A0AAV1EH83_OLDCO|nr:OLC1v1020669C1 [Oldenlandia corymbosa var. corymbosa]
MTGKVLECPDCFGRWETVEEAEEHAKHAKHLNFFESDGPVLRLVCTTCGKNCRSTIDVNPGEFVLPFILCQIYGRLLREILIVCGFFCSFNFCAVEFVKFQELMEEFWNEKVIQPSPRADPPNSAHDLIRLCQYVLSLCLLNANVGEYEYLFNIIDQRDLHKFWTGHDEYVDMPLQAAAPLILEAPTLATKTEQMRQCLQFIKQSHVADYDKVKVAFTTLLTFARNVALYPDDEKYRKIRITNDKFQERVGKLKGGIEFLELCGFEKLKDSPHLFMPREKVDKALLTAAGTELNNAINDPFFGFL